MWKSNHGCWLFTATMYMYYQQYKVCIWAMSSQNLFMPYTNMCSLIIPFVVCSQPRQHNAYSCCGQKSMILANFYRQADQPWVLPGRTTLQAHFLMKGLISNIWNSYNWAMTWENKFMPYANNKGADQSAQGRKNTLCGSYTGPITWISQVSNR